MNGETPRSISRGVEIQKQGVEAIRKEAVAKYQELGHLSDLVEAQIDAQLALDPSESDFDALAALFQKKHISDDIARDLEDIILRSFEREDELRHRWLNLEDRIHAASST